MMGTYSMLDLVPKGRDERDVPQQDGVGAPSRPLRARSRLAGACCAVEGLRPSPADASEHAMASLWPWLAVAGVGALHGLNPATGWLLAAAWGVRSRDRRQALRALLPIGVGHAASIALVAGAVALGWRSIARVLQVAAGALLLVAASLHLWRRAAPRGCESPAGHAGLALWSFMMATRARRGADAGAGAHPDLRRRRVRRARSTPRARCCWRSPPSPCTARRCSPSPARSPPACAAASARCGDRRDHARRPGPRLCRAPRHAPGLPVRRDGRLHAGLQRLQHRLVTRVPAVQHDTAGADRSAHRRRRQR